MNSATPAWVDGEFVFRKCRNASSVRAKRLRIFSGIQEKEILIRKREKLALFKTASCILPKNSPWLKDEHSMRE